MHCTVVVLFSLLSTGWSKDITLGSAEGRKIFDEVRQANPAIWRQYENVTVIAPENELIGSVVITDMRPEKDGDVQIINGGDGQKSVTIELKSPTVLRGYEFHIEVYSVPDTISSDAEEHLYAKEATPEQSNESTVQPDSASTDHEQTLNNESTVLPDNINSKDIKDFPTLVSDDVQNDSNRPARETEESNSQTDEPEDIVISPENKESTTESGDDASIESDKTTQTVIDDMVTDPSPKNVRPARETDLDTSVVTTALPNTESIKSELTTESASETLVTDATSVAKEATTTEAVVTTLADEQATFAPVVNDNSKNIPDYASLNILDYIKNKEGVRPVRRTEDDKVGTSEELNRETSILPENSGSNKANDDTADLVPPKIDADYNTDFANEESTAMPIEGSTIIDTNYNTEFTNIETTTYYPTEGSTISNVPRAGRGIDFESDNENESTQIPLIVEDESTTISATTDVTTATFEDHTIPLLDEQARNIRGANSDIGNENDVNISEEAQENVLNTEVPNGDVDPNQSNRKVIIINLEEYIARDENNRFMYALPIVLVINSENDNYPIIKIIAENSSNDRDKELFPTLPSNESLEPSEIDYKIMENDRIKGDYMPSADYNDSR